MSFFFCLAEDGIRGQGLSRWVGEVEKRPGNVQGTFRNGKKHGPWVTYHPDGEIESKGTFKNGKKDGPSARHYENGQ